MLQCGEGGTCFKAHLLEPLCEAPRSRDVSPQVIPNNPHFAQEMVEMVLDGAIEKVGDNEHSEINETLIIGFVRESQL